MPQGLSSCNPSAPPLPLRPAPGAAPSGLAGPLLTPVVCAHHLRVPPAPWRGGLPVTVSQHTLHILGV